MKRYNMRVVECPIRGEIEYIICRAKCKYYRPYGEDFIYCVYDDVIIPIKEKKNYDGIKK